MKNTRLLIAAIIALLITKTSNGQEAKYVNPPTISTQDYKIDIVDVVSETGERDFLKVKIVVQNISNEKTYTINTNGLIPGMYLVNILSENQKTITKKVIIS